MVALQNLNQIRNGAINLELEFNTNLFNELYVKNIIEFDNGELILVKWKNK